MPEPLVSVAPSLITVAGIDSLARRDLYFDAPEPPEEWNVDLGLRTNPANLLYLHERFPEAQWHDPGNRLVEARAYRFMSRVRTAEPGEYELSWPFKVQPKPYQLKLFTHARHLPCVALSPVALGTGKTKMALDICADKWLRNEIDAVAIICLNGLKRQWINKAVPQHLSDAVPRKCHVWKSTTKIPGDVAEHRIGARYMRVMAFNIEAFARQGSSASRAFAAFCRSGRVACILDESTRIKNYKVRTTKELLKLKDLPVFKMILTATPITKGLEDFFTQYQWLDERVIGMSNYFAFRGRYCVTRRPPGRNVHPQAVEIVGYRNQEELIRKIAPVSFMVPDSVLGLPPKRYERFDVEMTPEQDRVYSMLRDQLVEDLAAHRIENPAYAFVRLMRLQQVLCGRYYEESFDDETQMRRLTPRLLPNNRPEALANVLEQHDGQALVWCRFHDDIDDIVAAIGGLGRLGIYEGETSQAERDRQVAAFQRGELDYMILNMATGSTGIDGLQCANAAFYYSQGWNREHRWQSEGRIYRLGQMHSTLFGDFVVPGSIDVKILQAHAETADLARMVINNPEFLRGGSDVERVHDPADAGDAGRRVDAEF